MAEQEAKHVDGQLGRRTRIQIGVLIGVIGLSLSIYFNFFKGPRTTKETMQEITKSAANLAAQEHQADLSRKYQDLLMNATIDRELPFAVGTLRQISTISYQYRDHQNELMRWVGEEQLTNPEYVHVLLEAGFLLRRAVESRDNEGSIHNSIYWHVSRAGTNALHRNNFIRLRKAMQDSLNRATKFGVNVNRVLYGRYWGVGLVTKSDFHGCDEWQDEEEEEEARENAESKGHDNRIFGKIEVYVLAGVMCRELTCREGESVKVDSEPYNDYGIRGCPKEGDLVGYVEYDYAPIWEKLHTIRKAPVEQK